ncbi:proteinaceous RNase P 1, chloroplastic/mitochondrial [Magnolia sinica]|uniref:proteinaceous RNase P 1, chloroplastic/mitochondrial n=1 Tax=Magnolia sinica TaxID=86752 RepID=UPI0026591C7E|nr:proteinaceous RNase P 1, chloroplastic/mitochondrial [Magnolia sinica]
MLIANSLSPSSLLRYSTLISFFSKSPSSHHHAPISLPIIFHLKTLSMTNTIPSHHHHHRHHHDHHHHQQQQRHHLSSSVAATTPIHQTPTTTPTTKSKKKARRESPEGILRHSLDMCSKRGDLLEALRLYDDARSRGILLSQHHYNVLLYLCSSSSSKESDGCDGTDLGLKRGFEIFRQMGADDIPPNEATFTSVARLAAAMEDPELAFDLVKKMAGHDIPPRLRSYGPALFGFCSKGMADEAYEVDAHMAASGVSAEEPELAALLQLSGNAARGDRVYQLLHRLRATVRRVSESTAEIAEGWFGSDAAAEVGVEGWDVEKVKEGVVKGGGGWHGQGWLGKGKWKVARSRMDESGVCGCCGEKLVCIDIDPLETENFASSLSSLACQREVKADFTSFQEWLSRHGPFEAVIDGANVGLYNQHNFSFFQLNSVVNGIRQMSPSKKLPLIVLHSRRVKGGPAENPSNKKLLESWRRSGVLYTTPSGSNDDWYWLYAAVSCKCLLVTNDEMRDHLFELLGTSFFPRWKEKHQVRLLISRCNPIFHLPPPYSVVIQESEQGSWHIPIATGDDVEETNRQWVCVARVPIPPPMQSQVHVGQKKMSGSLG